MLKDDYHKKIMSQLAYGPVEYNYVETLAKTFIIPARQNQFIRENMFNNAPLLRIAIAMNSNSAFTGSFAQNPFCYQQLNLRDIRILKGGQPIVHHDTTDNWRLYVTTMKAMNFQDDIPSISVDNFKNHYVLVFDLTSLQDATEHCHYRELIGESLRLELYFNSPLGNITEVIVLGERMSSFSEKGISTSSRKENEDFDHAQIACLMYKLVITPRVEYYLSFGFAHENNTGVEEYNGNKRIMIISIKEFFQKIF